MHMKVVEDRESERGLRPFYCGRKQPRPCKLNSLWYILAATVFDTNLMNSICVNDHGVTPRSGETVLALLSVMSQAKPNAE